MSDYDDKEKRQNENGASNEQQMEQPQFQQHQYQHPQYNQSSNQPAPKKSAGMAIGSMVLGIVGFIISCIPYLSFPLGVAGLILGILSIRGKKDGRGMAIAGIIICSITIVIAVILFVFVASLFREGFTMEDFLSYMEGY